MEQELYLSSFRMFSHKWNRKWMDAAQLVLACYQLFLSSRHLWFPPTQPSLHHSFAAGYIRHDQRYSTQRSWSSLCWSCLWRLGRNHPFPRCMKLSLSNQGHNGCPLSACLERNWCFYLTHNWGFQLSCHLHPAWTKEQNWDTNL